MFSKLIEKNAYISLGKSEIFPDLLAPQDITDTQLSKSSYERDRIYEIVGMTAKPGTYKARNLSINAAVATSGQRRNRPIRKEFVMRKRIAAEKSKWDASARDQRKNYRYVSSNQALVVNINCEIERKRERGRRHTV